MQASLLTTRPDDEFDSKGPKVSRFCERFLTLNGSFSGRPFVPLQWMNELFDDVYRLNADGRRKHRTYLLGVPRKNAKSTIAAAIAVYQLIADRTDQAPQIISAAGDRKQARLVFEMARDMILASPELSEVCTVHRNEIRCNLNGGTYRAVSADAGLAHGLNPSTVIVDEYHVHKKDDLYIALTTGSAMREQPLTFVISTAGHDLDSPLGKLYTYAQKVVSGEVDDPTFGVTWYGPTEGEEFDPADEDNWRRTNPSFEIMNLDEFRSAHRSTRESEFIRYRCNGWTSAQDSWFELGRWDALTDKDLPPLAEGDRCVFGFDGAWSGDCTGIVAYRIDDRSLHKLALWERPDGDKSWRTPKAEVRDKMRQLMDEYKPLEVAADPFLFQEELQTLTDEGYPIVEFRTNHVDKMSAASKIFQDAVLDGELSHDGDPALARHLANTDLKIDHHGRRRPVKDYKSSRRHIDLTICSIVAVSTGELHRETATVAPRLIII